MKLRAQRRPQVGIYSHLEGFLGFLSVALRFDSAVSKPRLRELLVDTALATRPAAGQHGKKKVQKQDTRDK